LLSLRRFDTKLTITQYVFVESFCTQFYPKMEEKYREYGQNFIYTLTQRMTVIQFSRNVSLLDSIFKTPLKKCMEHGAHVGE
jgi:hypothetical protein